MINYLERALNQTPESREPLPDSVDPSLPAALTLPSPARTAGRSLLPERTKDPSPLSQRDAPETRATAPAPGVLDRSLSRAAEPALIPWEEKSPVPLEEAAAFRRRQDANPLYPQRAASLPADGQSRPLGPASGSPGDPTLAPAAVQAPLLPPSSPFDLPAALRRADSAADFVRRQSRTFSVTLPDTPARLEPSLTPQDLDRAVERDARRYDGGFSLY